MQLVLLLILFLIPGIALANAGLPMLAVVWPFSALAIYPVIAIESVVVVSHILKLPMRTVFFGVTVANVFSTLIGIPLTWAILATLEILVAFCTNLLGISFPPQTLGSIGITILTAPFLLPIPGYDGSWVIPLATIVLLIPFFFTSYKIESWLIVKIFSPESPEQAKKAIWIANLLSYVGLFLCCAGWLLLSLVAQE